MCVVQAANPYGCCDEAKKPNTLSAGAFERIDGGDGAAAGSEHWVEQKNVALGGVARHLEIIVDGLECVVIAIQPDVPDARRGHEFEDAIHHAKAGAQDWNQRELLAGHASPGCALKWRLHIHDLERKVGRRLVRHQHSDLVDQLLEDLLGGVFVADRKSTRLNSSHLGIS